MTPIQMTGAEYNSKYTNRLYLKTKPDGIHMTQPDHGQSICIDRSPYEQPLVDGEEFDFYVWDVRIPEDAVVDVYEQYLAVSQCVTSYPRTVFKMSQDELNHWIAKNADNRKWIESEAFKLKGGQPPQVTVSVDPPKSWKGSVRSFGVDFLD